MEAFLDSFRAPSRAPAVSTTARGGPAAGTYGGSSWRWTQKLSKDLQRNIGEAQQLPTLSYERDAARQEYQHLRMMVAVILLDKLLMMVPMGGAQHVLSR